MKKARIIMSIIVLLTTVGYILAFKTAKFNGHPLYTLVTVTIINGNTFQTMPNQPSFCAVTCFATTTGEPVFNALTSTFLSGDPSVVTLTNTVLNQTTTIRYLRCTTTLFTFMTCIN